MDTAHLGSCSVWNIDTVYLNLLSFGGQVVFALTVAANVMVHAEKDGFLEGLWHQPDHKPHYRLHQVRESGVMGPMK